MASALPGRIASACLQWALGRSWEWLMRGTSDPLGVQTQRLITMLHHNSDTEIGRRYGFRNIRSFDEYRRRVPVHTYEDFRPAIDRMTAGETRVLTADKPTLYCQTSGTTGKPKYIPVTPGYIEEFSRTQKMWLRQLMSDHPGVLSGRILSIVSPAEEGRTADGTPFGAVSGYSYSTQYAVARAAYVLPYAAMTIHDFTSKYYTALRIALGKQISMVVATNPSTLVLLAKLMHEHAEAIIKDVRDGTLTPPSEMPSAIAHELTAKLKPDATRAAELEAVIAQTDGLRPKDAWPHLALVATWQGGTAPFYLRQLPEYYGSTPVRDLGLIASEGYMTVPLADGTPGGLAALSGLAMEFQPLDSEGAPEDIFLHAGQLEVGDRYNLLLTNSGGLYRYDIGDVVEVLEKMGGAPILAFRHKVGNVLSITGEKVTETQVIDAMTAVSQELDLTMPGFTVSLDLGDTPAFLVAAEPGVSPELLAAFDVALRERNIEYDAKRTSLRLDAPRGLDLPDGTYAWLRKESVAAGAPDGQWKVPHVVHNAETVRNWRSQTMNS